ncbi:MAG TPA: type II toxin-antitoxin system RelE/ParE family toxin [Pseudonocardiaceae bacterium]|nr:type II toxin-antitoxin system RelE/ParE family toxin [Pseudonocardiaceae bacterium]
MANEPLYQVALDKNVEKEVAKLDKPVRRRIQAALLSLATDPRPTGVVAMVGRPGILRLRVGDYRVIYTVRDHELLVLVIDVDHRSRIYRSL